MSTLQQTVCPGAIVCSILSQSTCILSDNTSPKTTVLCVLFLKLTAKALSLPKGAKSPTMLATKFWSSQSKEPPLACSPKSCSTLQITTPPFCAGAMPTLTQTDTGSIFGEEFFSKTPLQSKQPMHKTFAKSNSTTATTKHCLMQLNLFITPPAKNELKMNSIMNISFLFSFFKCFLIILLIYCRTNLAFCSFLSETFFTDAFIILFIFGLHLLLHVKGVLSPLVNNMFFCKKGFRATKKGRKIVPF